MNVDDQDDKAFEQELKEHGGKIRVTVTYVNTSTEVAFRMPASATLKETFDQAYRELKEQPRPDDKFFCEGGADMTPHLSKTLEQLHRQKICRKRRFQIACETGGA